MAFKPPPVDPAQAPIPAKAINKYGTKRGKEEWSVTTNPVVVAKEIVWNKDRINVSILGNPIDDWRTTKIIKNELIIIKL